MLSVFFKKIQNLPFAERRRAGEKWLKHLGLTRSQIRAVIKELTKKDTP